MRRLIGLFALTVFVAALGGCPDQKSAGPDPSASGKTGTAPAGSGAAPKASASSAGEGW